jgi:glycogen(starch) synthase
MAGENGSELTKGIIDSVLLVSVDNPDKNGGVGGKHTHIRLLLDGLRRARVEAQCVSPPDDLSFKAFHLYPGSLVRRFINNKDERYCNWFSQIRKGLKKNLKAVKHGSPVHNPQDVVSLLDTLSDSKERNREIGTVLTLHGYYTDEMISVGSVTKGSPTAQRMKRAELAAYERADRIVCVDNRIRKYVLDTAIVKNDVQVIPNAIDVDLFKPAGHGDNQKMRDGLGFEKDQKIIICARRLVPKNGVEFAVMAMPMILRQAPNAVLVVAGDGPQRGLIESKIKELGLSSKVRMLGSLPHDQMLGYTQIADVEVVPSIISNNVEEATSLAMLEGMACEKPLVVSRIGGLSETIVDGRTGLFSEQGDSEDIADKVTKVLTDRELARSLGTHARDYVVEKHSHLSHAKRFIVEYQKALR